jgi:malonyl-CoA/methylmalonyl-CoA synthetase
LEGERRAGTVGFPLPGVDVRICAEDGAPCAAGAVGDLQVRGENVFAGYWNLPEKTAEDFTPDGFFNTGDQASADEEGYIAIVGRSKDMVISGGLNIYPREIELLINSIPGIDESAVIGIPDADFGEALVAVVVRTEGEAAVSPEEVIEALRERIAGFKVPKTVRIVEELPRNAMGKVQKAELRRLYS